MTIDAEQSVTRRLEANKCLQHYVAPVAVIIKPAARVSHVATWKDHFISITGRTRHERDRV